MALDVLRTETLSELGAIVIYDKIKKASNDILSKVFPNRDFEVKIINDAKDGRVSWLDSSGIVADVSYDNRDYYASNIRYEFNREIIINANSIMDEAFGKFEELVKNDRMDNFIFVYVASIIYREIAHMEYFDEDRINSLKELNSIFDLNTKKVSFVLNNSDEYDFEKALLEYSSSKTEELCAIYYPEDDAMSTMCECVNFLQEIELNEKYDKTDTLQFGLSAMTKKKKENYISSILNKQF